MLKAGLHFLLSSLGVLGLWLLDVPFFSGAWVRCFCTTGFGCAALFLVGSYLWLKRAQDGPYNAQALCMGRRLERSIGSDGLHHTSNQVFQPLDWDFDDDLEAVYHRR